MEEDTVMARPIGNNDILKVENGVAFVDVSTKKHPNAVAKVDVADLDIFNDGNGRWQARSSVSSGPYVMRNKRLGPVFCLHRVLLGLTDWQTVGDHRNADGLDNRRENLRTATRSENARNCTSHKGSSSQYLGVWWERGRGWRAAIRIDRKLKCLGRYKVEADAGRAYDEAAREYFGEFANLNFPEAVAA